MKLGRSKKVAQKWRNDESREDLVSRYVTDCG
jgi:hypothetical protein